MKPQEDYEAGVGEDLPSSQGAGGDEGKGEQRAEVMSERHGGCFRRRVMESQVLQRPRKDRGVPSGLTVRSVTTSTRTTSVDRC